MGHAQCRIEIQVDTLSANLIEICIGDSVPIKAVGECILLQESFNNMAFGSSEWNYIPSGVIYNNPCMSSSNGSSYAWFGAFCPPTREIVTKDFNLIAGGYISFDLRYGLQGSGTPCDGPDAMREGISLQYSTDFGDNWFDIAYFAPTGNILPTNPFTTLPTTFGPTNFTAWDKYTFQIPTAARTAHTRIRWVQFYVNYYNGHYDDSWGIDNIIVSRSIDMETRWDFGPDTTHPGWVTPLDDSVFVVYLLDYTFPFDTIATDSLRVIVHPIPEFEYLLDTNRICYGDSIEISVTGTYNYTWNNGAVGDSLLIRLLSQTTFTTTSTDNIGCHYTDSITIFIEPLPVINVNGDTICRGDTAVLSASGGVTYRWTEGVSTSSIYISPTSSTLYHVTVTGANNCSDTASVLALVWQLPLGKAYGDTVICHGDYAGLYAAGGQNILWNNGTNVFLNEVSPAVDTWYTVTITDVNDCYVVDSVLVRVNPFDTIGIAAFPDTVCRGTSSLLTVDAGYCQWNTGDFGSTIDVWPGATSIYTVTVSEEYYGLTCSLEASVTIEVEECNTFHIANAFNPEGYSQVFKPIGNSYSISNYYFAVYDRWGKMVFETTNWDSGWDGRINGSYAPNAAYVFIVRFTKEYLNQQFEKIGTVTVIR